MFNGGGLGALVLFAVIGMIVGIVVGIAFYIFYAYALYRLAKSRNIEMAWLAWIPIAHMYVIGKLAKSIKISDIEIPSLEIVLPVSMVVYILLNRITVLGTIITLLFIVLNLLSLYSIYKQYVPENGVVYTVLSILVIPVPFFLLKLSKTEPVSIP